MQQWQRWGVGPTPWAHQLLAATAAALVCSLLLLSFPAPSGASTWTVALTAGSAGESQAGSPPGAPTGVAAACGLLSTNVTVTWSGVAHASTYTVEESTTSSSSGYSAVASGLTGTSWTSGALPGGSYWFEVVADAGANWASTPSAPTAQITILLGLSCS
ncbi:MAG: hypothetical protein ACYC1D_07580 [Acidimicrobiales bacterium]